MHTKCHIFRFMRTNPVVNVEKIAKTDSQYDGAMNNIDIDCFQVKVIWKEKN